MDFKRNCCRYLRAVPVVIVDSRVPTGLTSRVHPHPLFSITYDGFYSAAVASRPPLFWIGIDAETSDKLRG
jgi:hypothetical protein